jgi:myosin heavy subunit
VNSFEQFCINYANERLQYYFNQHIFKLEQEEYTKEGINWSKIEFVDNQSTIDLIAKKPVGLLLLLDEESNFPKGTDLSLLAKCHQNYADHSNYVKPKTQQPVFGVRHYAGDVMYLVDGFLDKNRDSLRADLMEVMKQSTNELISLVFGEDAENPEESLGSMGSMAGGSSSSLSLLPTGPGGTISRGSSKTMTLGRSKTSKSPTAGAQFNVSAPSPVHVLPH